MGVKDNKAKQVKTRTVTPTSTKRAPVAAVQDRERSRSQSKPSKTAAQKPILKQTKAPRPAPVQDSGIDLSELLGAGSIAKPVKQAPAKIQTPKATQSPAPSKKAAPKVSAPKKPASRGIVDLDELLECTPVAEPEPTPARVAQKPIGKSIPQTEKISHFMGLLKSRDRGNARHNAELLASIIQAFGEGVDITSTDIIQMTLSGRSDIRSGKSAPRTH